MPEVPQRSHRLTLEYSVIPSKTPDEKVVFRDEYRPRFHRNRAVTSSFSSPHCDEIQHIVRPSEDLVRGPALLRVAGLIFPETDVLFAKVSEPVEGAF